MTKGRITSVFGAAAPVAERPSVNISAFSSPNVTMSVNSKGLPEVRGLRIFKTGTFPDSFGISHTWEDVHLDQMVMHFKLLKDNGIFPNVPWRSDHSFSVEKVIGYLTAVFRDPEDPTFLASAMEFTESDAYDKYQRGTYRSRSLEVGLYETNSGATYFPVVMGVAFVDIPAVEGLHSAPSNAHTFSQVITDTKEMPVSTQNPDPAVVPAPAVAPVPTNSMILPNTSTFAASTPTPPTPPAEPNNPQPAPTPPAPQPQPQPSAEAAPQLSLFGRPTTDFAAVQRHITTLETFRQETIEMGRRDFVTNLAHSNKIAATQIDSMAALVLTMNDEQFAAFRATYEAAGAAPLFAPHGQQSGTSSTPQGAAGPPNEGQPNAEPNEMDILEETVANHKRAGMSEETIEKTSSYKKLQALKSATHGQPAV